MSENFSIFPNQYLSPATVFKGSVKLKISIFLNVEFQYHIAIESKRMDGFSTPRSSSLLGAP